MLRPVILSSIVALTLLLAAAGVLAAWVLRRRSTLSVRNLYFVAVPLTVASATAIAAKHWPAVTALIPLSAGPVAGALAGRGWRLSDLGAGEELRQYEIERRWFWQPAPRSRPGERTYIGSQGELISVRPWPSEVEYVPMSTPDASETRLPLGEGQHVFICGGTGTARPPPPVGY